MASRRRASTSRRSSTWSPTVSSTGPSSPWLRGRTVHPNPSSTIAQGYETVIVKRKGGELVSGTLQRRTDAAVLIREPSGEIVSIPNGDVEKLDTSPVSLMPPGLTDRLRRDELIDLMRFLTSLGKKDELAK